MRSEETRLYHVIAVYSLVMLIVFLAIGVLYREYSKAMVGGDAGDIVVMYYLSLSHGHVLLTGVVVPVLLLFLTYIIGNMTGKKPNYRELMKAFTVYVAGSLGMDALLIYKGMAIIYYYTQYGSLEKADAALFAGNHVLREALYGTIHLLLGIGLTWYVLKLLGHLRKYSGSANEPSSP